MSRALPLPALALLLAGCAGVQSALDPYGPQAGSIARMSWIIFAVATVILLAVTVMTVLAVRRRREERPGLTERQGWILVIVSGVAVPVVLLFAFLVYSVWVGGRAASAPPGDALTIEVIARQWWWDFHYRAGGGARTSNQIHIPVGRPVRFELRSVDVIHSFWIPNLHGKMDAVPGRINTIWMQADRPGSFRGQCAEFCGLQHALMAFTVVAEPEADFERWLEHQRSPAVEPADPLALAGREVFLERSCGLCHAIRGTTALGRVGPDLTHVGSRPTLAAGTIPNTPGHMAGWIVDPQSIKPGNHMPPNQLPPEQLTALLRYLEILK